jgi:hypothetical protein
MSDSLSNNSENPDALPVNERSSAFIDGAAYLEFVRLKSLVAHLEGNAEKSGAFQVPDAVAANDTSRGTGHTVSSAATDAHAHAPADSQIDIEDWDSLFDAVEQRLRDSVERPDSVAMPLTARDNASRIKAAVLDCVSALDKLHKALQYERSAHATHPTHAANSDKPVASPLTNGHDPTLNNHLR